MSTYLLRDWLPEIRPRTVCQGFTVFIGRLFLYKNQLDEPNIKQMIEVQEGWGAMTRTVTRQVLEF